MSIEVKVKLPNQIDIEVLKDLLPSSAKGFASLINNQGMKMDIDRSSRPHYYVYGGTLYPEDWFEVIKP